MIIYDGLKSEFLKSVENETIAIQIQDSILQKMGKHTSASEFNSWRNSMQYMYMVMNDQDIPDDAGIAIEYNVPQTAKRVDIMVSGYDENDNPGMVIVELKQWSEIKKIDDSDALVETYTGGANRQVVHPSYQAWSYARLIADYNSTVQDKNIKLAPCAYMHNYLRSDNDPIDDEQYNAYTIEAPCFTMGQTENLRQFIKKCVVKGDKKEVIYNFQVNWKCDVCGYKWAVAPNSRVRNGKISSCPHCSGRVAMPGIDDLETLYPAIAKEWDFDQNKGVLPSQIRPYSNHKYYWVCPKCHNSYEAYPGSRVKGSGCPDCAKIEIGKKNSKKVGQYDADGNLLSTYYGLHEAARVMGVGPNAIFQAVKNGGKSKGFYWRYISDDGDY